MNLVELSANDLIKLQYGRPIQEFPLVIETSNGRKWPISARTVRPINGIEIVFDQRSVYDPKLSFTDIE